MSKIEPTHNRRRRTILVTILVLLVLYVASVGPAVALAFQYHCIKTVATIYYPVILAANQSGMGGALDWWIMWWFEAIGVDPDDFHGS